MAHGIAAQAPRGQALASIARAFRHYIAADDHAGEAEREQSEIGRIGDRIDARGLCRPGKGKA
jgi:hypothetical protein